jgi:hypothetical protein
MQASARELAEVKEDAERRLQEMRKQCSCTEAQLRESNEEKGVLSEQVRVYYHLLCSGMWEFRSQLSGCKAAQ